MEPLSFLANLLLSVTVGTLMVALIAYMAYKLREMRAPQPHKTLAFDEEGAPVFLQLYVPRPDELLPRSVQTEQ